MEVSSREPQEITRKLRTCLHAVRSKWVAVFGRISTKSKRKITLNLLRHPGAKRPWDGGRHSRLF